MIVKLLTEHGLKCLSLKGGCTGLSKSTHVKMPHCWKSHVVAHLLLKDAEKFKNVGFCQFKVAIHVLLISNKTGLCT